MEQSLWALKTVKNADRALQTIDNYEDQINSVYNYDSMVANHKQIRPGDNIILLDKKRILGFAQIERIEEKQGSKIIRKCPNCGSSTIDTRKNISPKFRCNKGHEFEIPIEKYVDIKRFSANYKNTYISFDGKNGSLNQLRPYYLKGYNQNMSMQLMSIEALKMFSEAEHLLNINSELLSPYDGIANAELFVYEPSAGDERQVINRQIKERRGQQKFRAELLERFGATCMITNCKILDILEAAHINPYRGINDNHPSNGLILRADIHTLFDLNLIGINPETLVVHFHKKAKFEYEAYNERRLLCDYKDPFSKPALIERWKKFDSNQKLLLI